MLGGFIQVTPSCASLLCSRATSGRFCLADCAHCAGVCRLQRAPEHGLSLHRAMGLRAAAAARMENVITELHRLRAHAIRTLVLVNLVSDAAHLWAKEVTQDHYAHSGHSRQLAPLV